MHTYHHPWINVRRHQPIAPPRCCFRGRTKVEQRGMGSRSSSHPLQVPGNTTSTAGEQDEELGQRRGSSAVAGAQSAQPAMLSPVMHASMLSVSRGHFSANPSPQQLSASLREHARPVSTTRSMNEMPDDYFGSSSSRHEQQQQPLIVNEHRFGPQEQLDQAGIPERDSSSHTGHQSSSAGAASTPMKVAPPRRGRHLQAVLFGITSWVCCIPTQLAYGNITYSDSAFQNSSFLPFALKLVFASATVTELVFVLRSRMKFAVGQVQDAGLIFLSQMASSLAERIDGPDVHGNGVSETAMATVLAALCISTLLTGIFLIALGRFKLATLTNYIPLPVISGNLAFIGAFCFASAIKLMSGGVDLLSLSFPTDKDITHVLALVLPGVIFSVVMIAAQRVSDNFAVLPLLILSIPVLFYGCLWLFGFTRTDAIAFGYLDEDKTVTIWDSFALLRLELVQWNQLPSQLPNLLGLWLIVALGSTLDISACELALGSGSIDLNHEIEVIGWGNIFSGICLGGTSSVLFGQSTLAIKAGIQERSFGITLCLLELVVVLLPYDITAFLPRPLFGAVLSFIGLDILLDWLYFAKAKITSVEYGAFFSSEEIENMGSHTSLLLLLCAWKPMAASGTDAYG